MKTAVDEEGRPLRADAARNRERILTAAAEVFAERGLDATLDEIAHRAGVGVGTVYRRFPGKEELIEALFEQAVNELVDLAEAALAHEDSWDGLVWFLERAASMQATDRGLRDVVLHSGYGLERVAHARGCIVPIVTRLIERAQADGYLRPDLVPADVPIIELMVSTVATYTSGLAPDLWRRYLNIVLDGLATDRVHRTDLSAAPSHDIVEAAMRCNKSRRL
ncbi:MAG: helix-turn-helix domain-containing protein [Acidimicrobiales bacterium]|jgi:AcrR family transcriptional regulator